MTMARADRRSAPGSDAAPAQVDARPEPPLTSPRSEASVHEVAIESLPSGLADRLVADATRLFESASEPRVAQAWLLNNPYSTVFRVRLSWPAGQRCVYVKFPHKRPVNERLLPGRLATEFAILAELSGRFGAQGRLGVVEPFAHYPELLAIATVEATGEPLRRHVARDARRFVLAPGRRRSLLSYAELCGEWLRKFHEFTSRGTGSFDIGDLTGYCRGRLSALEKTGGSRVDQRLSAAVLDRIRQVASNVAAADNPIAGRHNDFATHNIIVSDESGIRVLDFSMFDHGSTYFDVCNFWLELELLKSDPSYSARTLARLQQAFLTSYGSLTPADPLFELVRGRYVLNRLLTALKQRPGFSIAAWYRRRVAHACYRWLQGFAGRKTP